MPVTLVVTLCSFFEAEEILQICMVRFYSQVYTLGFFKF